MAECVTETVRPIEGFPGYHVSDQGNVYSTWIRGRSARPDGPMQRLSPALHVRGGYPYVTLHRGGRHFHRKVHHLVCEMFNGPRPPGTVARHLDGNPSRNVPDNLAWGTSSQNNYDRVRHGTHHNAVKTHCKHGHPLSGSNLYINPASGSRQCRICQARAKRDYAMKRGAR